MDVATEDPRESRQRLSTRWRIAIAGLVVVGTVAAVSLSMLADGPADGIPYSSAGPPTAAAPPVQPSTSVSTDPSKPMTKAAYVAAAETICQKYALQTKSLVSAAAPPDTTMEKFLVLGGHLVQQLEALPAPTQDSVMLHQIYSDLAAERALGDKTVAAFRSGNVQLMATLSAENVSANNKVLARLASYGITACHN
ncbi:hypothetical protein acdb102_42540 [Acidothermaceae bacterium B102]|nr:hypothetical protein acdb102_42540 [Acidothermaceae bacterium B102]